MTVGELKLILAELPDRLNVILGHDEGGYYYDLDEVIPCLKSGDDKNVSYRPLEECDSLLIY